MSAIGTCYFKDGHAEEIISLHKVVDTEIYFRSRSGTYKYYAYISESHGIFFSKYESLKQINDNLDGYPYYHWGIVDTIDRIEVIE